MIRAAFPNSNDIHPTRVGKHYTHGTPSFNTSRQDHYRKGGAARFKRAGAPLGKSEKIGPDADSFFSNNPQGPIELEFSLLPNGAVITEGSEQALYINSSSNDQPQTVTAAAAVNAAVKWLSLFYISAAGFRYRAQFTNSTCRCRHSSFRTPVLMGPMTD